MSPLRSRVWGVMIAVAQFSCSDDAARSDGGIDTVSDAVVDVVADAIPDAAGEDGPPADAAHEDASADAAHDAATDALADASSPCVGCTYYGSVTITGNVANTAITELSGLGASRIHEGVFYAHDDSGESARFFAIDLTGASRGEFRLATGGTAVDWEDLSVGPCDSGSCVFVGDIGDNAETRTNCVVYVVPEPLSVDSSSPTTVTFDALPFLYPDGSHNAEALLVHPHTGDIYIVTKSNVSSGVFKFPRPFTPGEQVELLSVGALNASASGGQVVTGGDIHPCGARVAIRTYGQLLEYALTGGEDFDELFDNAPTPLAVASEPQGEAVAYMADGLGYVTISEGIAAAVNSVVCE